jgi:hypothetical protein
MKYQHTAKRGLLPQNINRRRYYGRESGGELIPPALKSLVKWDLGE